MSAQFTTKSIVAVLAAIVWLGVAHAAAAQTSSAQTSSAQTSNADATTMQQRLRRLERKAAKVESLTERVNTLQGEVTHLREKLSRYEHDSPHADSASADALTESRARVIRRYVRRVLADSERRSNGGGYGEGFDLAFWGWLSYLHQDDADRNTFWAWEVELAATKTFSDRLAASFDVQFIDTNNGSIAELEQAFVSMVAAPAHRTVLTFGKFNAPFGIEARDFWDRDAGSTSLLFDAMPKDLTGVMLTQPVDDMDLMAQPFVVNGFDDDLDTNQQPSVGLTLTHEPTDDLRFSVTNYYGPENANDVSEKLYFLLLEGS